MKPLEPYAEVDVSRPVLKDGLDADALCKRLLDQIEIELPPSDRKTRTVKLDYTECTRAVGLFATFLQENFEGRDTDEECFLAFRAWLDTKGFANNTVIALVRHVRNLVNRQSTSFVNRPVLDEKAYRRATRFDGLADSSKKYLLDYYKHGCRLRNGRLSSTPLKETCKENALGAVLRLLKDVGKTDVLAITEDDAEAMLQSYSDQGKRASAIDQLAAARQFFATLQVKKIITSNPLERFTSKSGKVDDDFVPQAEIEKLRNLSTVNMKFFDDVRNRLIAFTLCYDFALRIGEVAQLKVSDVGMSNFVELTIRSEIQKGSDKRKLCMFSYFTESKTLMQEYLSLRTALNLSTDALLVSQGGTPLSVEACRDAVVKDCLALHIKTFEGRRPNPHRLRHSFGTLNVSPLGLSLNVYQVMQRLRHSDIKTTTKIYIANNPVLQLEQHTEIVRNHKVQTSPTPMVPRTPIPVMPFDASRIEFVSELDAVVRLKELGITWQGLRKHCEEINHCRQMDGAWMYSSVTIGDLEQNWATKKRARAILRIGNSGFWYWAKANAVRVLTIGKVTLVPWSSLMKTFKANIA